MAETTSLGFIKHNPNQSDQTITANLNLDLADELISAIDVSSLTGKDTSILAWAYAESYRLVSATRDSNGAITTASIIWPDGATGTFTTDTASTAFPGAIDAYHVTHTLDSVTTTYTQPAVTRDATTGAVTAQPAITVS